MKVCAVVVVGGSRPGEGRPDATTALAGVPMVVRSVRALLTSGVVDRVLLDGGGRTDVALACAGLPVDVRVPGGSSHPFGAHAGQRADATMGDDTVTSSSDEIIIFHDAIRPLTPPSLFVAVLRAVCEGHDVVVPVLPLTDTVKQVDADGFVRGTPDRGGFRLMQTPYAVRGGTTGPVHTVPGDPLAFAVRTPWDLELAELLAEGRVR